MRVAWWRCQRDVADAGQRGPEHTHYEVRVVVPLTSWEYVTTDEVDGRWYDRVTGTPVIDDNVVDYLNQAAGRLVGVENLN